MTNNWGGGDTLRAWVVAVAVCMFPSAIIADDTIVVAAGWRYQIHFGDVPAVDTIALGPDGALYATSDLPDGRGQVLRLQNGLAHVVVGRLSRPDGLHAKGNRLYITEEVIDGRVLEFDLDSGMLRTLAVLRSPEGIALARDGSLFVAEDQVNGRIVRVQANGQVEVYIGGLNRPEGICLGKDDTLYIAETATGRVLSYRAGVMRTVIEDLDEPDHVKLGPDGSLWITEGTSPGRLLRLRDGKLDVIASGLAVPQGIAFTNNGQVLIAEQGRNRILAVMPDTVGKERRTPLGRSTSLR